MTGIVNSTGAKSGIIGTTVGTPAGGIWTQLDSGTVSGANFDVDPGSTRYERLMFKLIGGIPANDVPVRMRFGTSAGAVDSSGGYNYHSHNQSEEYSTYNGTVGADGDYIQLASDTGIETGEGLEINGLINHATGHYASGVVFCNYQQHNNAYPLRTISFLWLDTSTIRNIRIYSTSDPTAGVLTVWGLTVT